MEALRKQTLLTGDNNCDTAVFERVAGDETRTNGGGVELLSDDDVEATDALSLRRWLTGVIAC